jgi:hypothetical protein
MGQVHRSLESSRAHHDQHANSAAVKRRCTSTWSSSATSTPASPRPPAVSTPPRAIAGSSAHIQHRLDLQVRRYRQAYHREVREGMFTLSLSWSAAGIRCILSVRRQFCLSRKEGCGEVGYTSRIRLRQFRARLQLKHPTSISAC